MILRGDDAVTANQDSGINMYGENGFHLEFKDVGAGTERDYQNFNTGTAGFGSDTSSTQKFADEATSILVTSRSNQANGSIMFVNERTQSPLTRHEENDTSYHGAAQSLFGVTSNTANVSIASGGTRNY